MKEEERKKERSRKQRDIRTGLRGASNEEERQEEEALEAGPV